LLYVANQFRTVLLYVANQFRTVLLYVANQLIWNIDTNGRLRY